MLDALGKIMAESAARSILTNLYNIISPGKSPLIKLSGDCYILYKDGVVGNFFSKKIIAIIQLDSTTYIRTNHSERFKTNVYLKDGLIQDEKILKVVAAAVKKDIGKTFVINLLDIESLTRTKGCA